MCPRESLAASKGALAVVLREGECEGFVSAQRLRSVLVGEYEVQQLLVFGVVEGVEDLRGEVRVQGYDERVVDQR